MRRKLAVAGIVLFEVGTTFLLLYMGLDGCGVSDDRWHCNDTLFYVLLVAWWVVPALAFIYDQAAKAKKRPPS
jgi:hypothetical protein